MTMWENPVEKEHHGKPVPEGFISGEGALPEAPLTPPSIFPDIPSDLPAAGHVEFLRKRRMLAKVLQQLQASGLPGQEQAQTFMLHLYRRNCRPNTLRAYSRAIQLFLTILWRVVRVPSREDEDARHLHRDLEALKRERTRYRNRIHGILIQQGLRINNPSKKRFVKELDLMRTWDGRELPPEMKVRLVRVHERLRKVEEQISSLVKEKTQRLQEENARMAQVAQLLRLPGIGPVSSWTFVMEFFGWRRFRNRREVAALAGLTPTPYDSGSRLREQGISKAGNRRVRTLAIEIAWAWLRFQPQSKLSRWFLERFAGGGSRMRRIGIVALARRLLIDLWRFLEYGVVPEGAQVRPLAI